MIKGKGVSEGIAFGKVFILEHEEIKVEDTKIEDTENEINIFNKALNSVIEETQKLIHELAGTEKNIMEAYLMILQDDTLIQETKNLITLKQYNAAYATEQGFNNIIKIFENMDDSYMAARSSDIKDMKNKILSKILNKEIIDLSELPENTVIVANELTTSDTAKLNLKNIAGIITKLGGITSHVSIMARTNEIPAIVDVENYKKEFKEKEFVAMNGTSGEIFVNPSKERIEELKRHKQQIEKEKQELEKYKNKESKTIDNHKVEVLSNIGIPKDADIAINNTAEGIGLFRSEFLYMNSDRFPTEEEQFRAYKNVVQKFKDKKVVIRTLDIGGDKDLKYMKLPKEENPFLGYRAIRICLDNTKLFKTQLRAILRASEYGNISIMIPMISSLEELKKAKEIIKEVKKDLINENIKFKKDIKVGIMIEIPATALIAEELAKECDFFSIGTNDLIQYTVAVERGNEKIADLYTKYHPAVIKLIKLAIDGAHKNNITCGMCGEAASDPLFIPLLIGLGLDEFSMNASKVLKARKTIINLNYKSCVKLTEEVLRLASSEEVKKQLDDFFITSN